jgi:hypothetical protein
MSSIDHSGKARTTHSRDLSHRDLAAFLAIAVRSLADSILALALPPFCPPSRPRATACGFFPASGGSSGVPSRCSPMARSTTLRATVTKSWSLLERVGINKLWHACGIRTSISNQSRTVVR